MPYKEPEKWVFVVGCYNSGTTLLEDILGMHPKISTMDEGVFFTDELLLPEELGWTRMWCQVVDSVRLTENDHTPDVTKVKKDWGVFFDRKKPVYLEKSIVNSARMRWLQANFRNSYFVSVIRDCYAASEGIYRKSPTGAWGIQKEEFKGKYPIELCAKQWVVNNRIIEEDSAHIDRFMAVRYESLCESPRNTIEKIYEFLDIDGKVLWDEKAEWNIHGRISVLKNMNPYSHRNLSKSMIEKIEETALESIRHYGYPVLSDQYGHGD
ncbi:MAG: sulfotransferase [Acidobacteria bacterium]|nr:sulfotransferase [Acidobacteriota bacterium]